MSSNRDASDITKKRQDSNVSYYYNNIAFADPLGLIISRAPRGLSASQIVNLRQARTEVNLGLTVFQSTFKIIPDISLYGAPIPDIFDSFKFAYIGAYQTFTVPRGAVKLFISMWGGGGALGNQGQPGGGGAYLEGKLAVSAGETVRIIVGKAGDRNSSYILSTMTDVDGGGGGGGGTSLSGQGGGRTAIQKFVGGAWVEVFTAGGGGGGGGNAGTYGGNAYFTGTSQTAGNTYGGAGGRGGSATAGGLAADGVASPNVPPFAGSQFTGGLASYTTFDSAGGAGGGGGGGGYYGGGGGGRWAFDNHAGGGGGSYNSPALVSDFLGSNGNGSNFVATGNAWFITGIGNGGGTGRPAGNGYVYLQPIKG